MNQTQIITKCKTIESRCYCYRECSNMQFLLDSFRRKKEDLFGRDGWLFIQRNDVSLFSWTKISRKYMLKNLLQRYESLLTWSTSISPSLHWQQIQPETLERNTQLSLREEEQKDWEEFKSTRLSVTYERAMKRKWKLQTISVLNHRWKLFIIY